MEIALENWCQMADETNMIYMKKYAKSLRRHKKGICSYTKHPLTTARIEAGNVDIGMIRKRARGIRDTEYFKLKIRQLSAPEQVPISINEQLLPHKTGEEPRKSFKNYKIQWDKI